MRDAEGQGRGEELGRITDENVSRRGRRVNGAGNHEDGQQPHADAAQPRSLDHHRVCSTHGAYAIVHAVSSETQSTSTGRPR